MDSGKKILIIEDDPAIRHTARLALASQGHRVLEAEGAQVGMHMALTVDPDLLVLDITLPDGSGLEVCRKLRKHKTLFATPIIMLTGNGQLKEKATGFEAGADQYLVKPVDPEELVMWVQALLNRLSFDKGEGRELKAGELMIDAAAHLVRYREQIIPDLTGKEFDLLYFLVQKRPQVLSRQHILSKLWRTVAVDNLVDTYLSRLRKKLPHELSDKIQNVPGKGFRFLE